MKRRKFIQGTVAAAAVMYLSPADTWSAPIKQDFTLDQRLNPIFALGKVQNEKIKLDVPKLAEDGSIVPISFEVDSPMTADNYIKTLWVLADKNPDPLLLTVDLTHHVGITSFETRIRMADAANVRVYAWDSKNNLYGAVKWVEATPGCA